MPPTSPPPADGLPPLVAGAEAVGRRIALAPPSGGGEPEEWPVGVVAAFDAARGRHRVELDNADAAAPPRAGRRRARSEEGGPDSAWALLSACRFAWLDPHASSSRNPTFSPAAPSGAAAVGRRVRVFWPAMGRWYAGRVTGDAGDGDHHRVTYADGDVQTLALAREAVVWAGLAPPRSAWPADDGAALGAEAEAAAARAKRARGGAGAGGDRAAPSPPKRARRAAWTDDESDDDGAPAPDSASSSSSEEEEENVAPPPRSARRGGPPSPPAKRAGGLAARGPPRTASRRTAAAAAAAVVAAAVAADADPGEGGVGGARRGRRARSTPQPFDPLAGLGLTPPPMGDVGDADVAGLLEGLLEAHAAHPGSAGGASSDEGDAPMPLSPIAAGLLLARDASKGGDGGAPRAAPLPPRPRSRSSRPSRRPASGGAAAAALGGRLAVWCDADRAFYRGTLSAYDAYHKRAKVAFDGGADEWLPLGRDRVAWLAPRARSAGGACPELAAAMAALGAAPAGDGRAAGGAAGAPPSPLKTAAAGAGSSRPPPPAAGASAPAFAPGDRVSLWFDAAACFCPGSVVDTDAASGAVRVLYDDGEDEWVAPASEALQAPPPPPPPHARPGAGVPGSHPGAAHTALAPRAAPPEGPAALGWRVAVYWRGDARFYGGVVAGFDPAAGAHRVVYDDGEGEALVLAKETVKWVLPPGARVGAPPQPARRSRSGARRRRDGRAGGGRRREPGGGGAPRDDREAFARPGSRRAAALAAGDGGGGGSDAPPRPPPRLPARPVFAAGGAAVLYPADGLDAPAPAEGELAAERVLWPRRGSLSVGARAGRRAGGASASALVVRLLLTTGDRKAPLQVPVDADVAAATAAAADGGGALFARPSRPPTAASAARPALASRPPPSPLGPSPAACGAPPAAAWAAARSPPCGPPVGGRSVAADSVRVVL